MILKTLIIIAMLLAGCCCYAQTPGAQFQSHSFQYLNGIISSSKIATNSVQAWNGITVPKWYSLFVTTTASGWTAALEGSLDNITWATIATSSANTTIATNTNPFPAVYLRVRATVLPANVQITATAIGTW